MTKPTAELIACPFCGAGETNIRENTHWTGMRSVVLSVEVCHWCEQKGQISTATRKFSIVGKTREEAIANWNTRHDADRLAAQEAAIHTLTSALDKQLERLDKIHDTKEGKFDRLADICNKIDEANFNAKQALQQTTEPK
jgi:hypothetical protein